MPGLFCKGDDEPLDFAAILEAAIDVFDTKISPRFSPPTPLQPPRRFRRFAPQLCPTSSMPKRIESSTRVRRPKRCTSWSQGLLCTTWKPPSIFGPLGTTAIFLQRFQAFPLQKMAEAFGLCLFLLGFLSWFFKLRRSHWRWSWIRAPTSAKPLCGSCGAPGAKWEPWPSPTPWWWTPRSFGKRPWPTQRRLPWVVAKLKPRGVWHCLRPK